ncbi:MAG: hypothetical protein HYS21_11015 [Deltaproteobacteria bacterium]|nr:hypothetical protein [Deltaproteobacteria bacterium]
MKIPEVLGAVLMASLLSVTVFAQTGGGGTGGATGGTTGPITTTPGTTGEMPNATGTFGNDTLGRGTGNDALDSDAFGNGNATTGTLGNEITTPGKEITGSLGNTTIDGSLGRTNSPTGPITNDTVIGKGPTQQGGTDLSKERSDIEQNKGIFQRQGTDLSQRPGAGKGVPLGPSPGQGR